MEPVVVVALEALDRAATKCFIGRVATCLTGGVVVAVAADTLVLAGPLVVVLVEAPAVVPVLGDWVGAVSTDGPPVCEPVPVVAAPLLAADPESPLLGAA